MSHFHRLKRAQVSLEFMLTYGWAITLFMGVLGILMYSGLFDVQYVVPERCEFYSGLTCIDYIASANSVTILLQNGLPVDMTNIVFSMDSCGQLAGPSVLLSGEQANYTASCPLSGMVRSTLRVNFTNTLSGFNHSKVGQFMYYVN
jgi:hypothetical protein